MKAPSEGSKDPPPLPASRWQIDPCRTAALPLVVPFFLRCYPSPGSLWNVFGWNNWGTAEIFFWTVVLASDHPLREYLLFFFTVKSHLEMMNWEGSQICWYFDEKLSMWLKFNECLFKNHDFYLKCIWGLPRRHSVILLG